MSQIAPNEVRAIALVVTPLTSMAGAAVAISVAIMSAKRANVQSTQSPTSAFVVMTALFAAMTGAMIYQGVSNGFPPAFVSAAVFLAGSVIALHRALRRPDA